MHKTNLIFRTNIPAAGLTVPLGSSLSSSEAESLSPILVNLRQNPLILGDLSIIPKLELETLIKIPEKRSEVRSDR
jgi:hypothetical protein